MFRKTLICVLFSSVCFAPVTKPYRGEIISHNNILRRNLVLYWPMNEGTGNRVFDSSAYGNTGILSNVGWEAAEYGVGCDFGGTNCVIYVVNNSTINITGDKLTLMCWFRPDAVGATQTLIWKGRTSNTALQYAMRLEADNAIHFYIYDGGAVEATSSTTVSAGSYYCAIGVYNGSNLQIYINGLADGSSTAHTGNIDGGSSNLGIGCKPDGTTDELNGIIQQVAIYDHAKSAREIAMFQPEPFFMFKQNMMPILQSAAAAAPAGKGQIIFIQMSAIPIIVIAGIVFAFILRVKNE